MSRIGKKIINVPNNVTLSFNNNKMTAKGPKGELYVEIPTGVDFSFENNVLSFSRESEDKKVRALHGLARALCFNAIEGVNNGFIKNMKIEGVGFRAEMKNERLLLTLGFSHQILAIPPTGIEFETPTPTTIIVKGIDKQLLGQVSHKIRSLRPPEPYKGKGIRYEGEYIRRKAGKTSGK